MRINKICEKFHLEFHRATKQNLENVLKDGSNNNERNVCGSRLFIRISIGLKMVGRHALDLLEVRSLRIVVIGSIENVCIELVGSIILSKSA